MNRLMEKQTGQGAREHRLTFQKITLTLSEWARVKKMKRSTLAMRIRLGWSIERALTTKTTATGRKPNG